MGTEADSAVVGSVKRRGRRAGASIGAAVYQNTIRRESGAPSGAASQAPHGRAE